MLRPAYRDRIAQLVERVANKYGIRVYRFANFGNHAHLLVQARARPEFQGFLRELSGRIATLVTGAVKGRPDGFWDGLAWSRLVSWGRDWKALHRYLIANLFEAEGWLDPAVKKKREYEIVTLGPD